MLRRRVDEILAWLQHPLFTVAGAPVTRSELIGDVTGLACVALVAKRHIANWPLGLVNNLFFFVTFWAAKLYADASLQIVFAVLGIYGWWTWQRASGATDTIAVRHTTSREWILLSAVAVPALAAATLLLSNYTDSPAPFFDASILVLSLVATYGQAKKLIESWWVWIVVDVISIPLYATRKLYPTAILYFIFLCLCVVGLRAWGRAPRETA